MRRVVKLLPCVLGSLLVLACRNSAHTTSTTGSGGTTSSSSSKAATTTTSTGMGGGMACDPGTPHTVQEVTTGALGSGTVATLKGVVAMSRKFLVSSKTTCLWGVFVSAPGITETAENTGLLALSYGTPPVQAPGATKAYCPELNAGTPQGDAFPEDVKPGDVLDISGKTASFPTMFNCMAPDPSNQVPMRQFSGVCAVTKTGTAAVPKAHLLTGADVASLISPTDAAFHDKWGGVKVRVENAAAIIATTASATGPDCSTMTGAPCVVRNFGAIQFDPGVPFGDKMYYRGYQKTQVCHAGPGYTVPAAGMPALTFASVEGFHYLDFCSWGLQVGDKCGDVNPPSPDCSSATPPVTTCAGVP